MNKELSNIHTWLCANKLSINIEKSNFILFRPVQKNIIHDIKLQIGGIKFKRVYSVRYLGVYIDSHLNWKSHIDYIGKKIKRSIGILSKIRYFTDINTLIKLYYALIYPFITYSIIV